VSAQRTAADRRQRQVASGQDFHLAHRSLSFALLWTVYLIGLERVFACAMGVCQNVADT
jgi:hypothetical protein